MSEMIRAPWASEQVDALNRFQQEGGIHPFTCGHEHPAHPNAILEATPKGWRCFVLDCEYEQDWAHAFMAHPAAWPRPFAGLRRQVSGDVGPVSGQREVRIRVTAPTDENAGQWAQTIADLVAGEYGQEMRLDIQISAPGPAGKTCCGMRVGHFPGCPVGRGETPR